jgi:hypothetical protein
MFSERLVDPALGHRVRIAVWAGVVHQFVHVPTQQVGIGLEAEQAHTRRVGEGAFSIQIDAVDPLSRRIQKQLLDTAGSVQGVQGLRHF